jgi:hypothetical protein
MKKKQQHYLVFEQILVHYKFIMKFGFIKIEVHFTVNYVHSSKCTRPLLVIIYS